MGKNKLFSVLVLLALAVSAGPSTVVGQGPPPQGDVGAVVTPQPPGPDLQPGVWEFIADNYLSHAAEFPDPNEPVEPLRLYLEGQEMLRAGKVDEAVALFRSAVAGYPDCRHAHAGLGYALWQRYQQSQAEDDLRVAVQEFILADEIGMKYGRVHYTYPVAIGLGQLKDPATMDSYFEKVLQDGNEYLASLDYARGLSLLEDSRAEEWYKKAIKLRPKGNVDALAYYAEWLLDQGREAEVLRAIRPDEHIEYLHLLRGVALERSGRLEEAREAYSVYIPVSTLDPAPAKYRIAGSKAQTGIIFEGDVVPQYVPCDGYEDLALVIECEAAGESEGGQRAVGWTVRTRVFKGTLPNCVYVDNSGTTLSCKYTNVIYQSGQFYTGCGRTPGTTPKHVRYDVWYGKAPDPTTGYCPSGSYSGDACSGSVHCTGSYEYNASSKGPMRFTSVKWNASCPTGGGYACLTSKGKTCGDRSDDPNNNTDKDWDHCFYNRP